MEIVDLIHIYGSRSYPYRDPSLIDDLIVHHSDGREPTSEIDALAAISEIDTFHRDVRGWPGIAYHLAVWRDCLFMLRPYNRNGWHSAGMDIDPRNGIGDGNDHGIAVVLLGTYTDHEPDATALRTIAEAKARAEDCLGRLLRLSGHQDWWATACPGNGWPAWRRKIVPPQIEPTNGDQQERINGLVTALADVCDRQFDLVEAETRRCYVRKTVLRRLVAQARATRRQFLGEHPA